MGNMVGADKRGAAPDGNDPAWVTQCSAEVLQLPDSDKHRAVRMLLVLQVKSDPAIRQRAHDPAATRALILDLLDEAIARVARAAAPTLYKDVKLLEPLRSTRTYFVNTLDLTADQLASKLAAKGLYRVVRVDSVPAQVLQLSDYPDAKEVEDVELEDGAMLAVIVDWPPDPWDMLSLPSDSLPDGWQSKRITEDQRQCDEWAVKLLQHSCTGVRPFLIRTLSGDVRCLLSNGLPDPLDLFTLPLEVELDALAVSPSKLLMLERKPQFTVDNVERLLDKKQILSWLVEEGAPNTEELLDLATGRMMPLEVVLLADAWEDDPAAAAACALRMQQAGIMFAMPPGGSQGVGDSFHPMAPQLEPDMEALAEDYLTRRKAAAAESAAKPAGSVGDGGSTAGSVGGAHRSSLPPAQSCAVRRPASTLLPQRRSIVPRRPLPLRPKTAGPGCCRRMTP